MKTLENNTINTNTTQSTLAVWRTVNSPCIILHLASVQFICHINALMKYNEGNSSKMLHCWQVKQNITLQQFLKQSVPINTFTLMHTTLILKLRFSRFNPFLTAAIGS